MTVRPFKSGFCSARPWPVAAGQYDSHGRCPGAYRDRPCVCACHTSEPLVEAVLPPVTDRYLGAVLELRTRADDLNETKVGELDWETVARALHHLVLARKTLQVVEDTLTMHLATVGRGAGVWDGVEVDGIGVVQVRRGRERKAWEHDRLVPAVIDAHMRESGGEFPDPFTLAEWLLETAHIDYWKTRALKKLDIPVDEFCESTPGRLSAQITTNDTIGAARADVC